ncbi:MAG: protein-(glutamine-N5) methyltransferase, release factor-specific [Candidatus Moranbacteria bacterium RIFOXYB1_FULL_43_19]|nr:MAG: protein-(glutamine-N5) methyltransferase, release factor-specific [Candidatus Moranbacteria bacterium RIFOXYB1_FULL_43_19]OGI33788.1 MAG: protein-(glutamine-N5) methyltransferase, release factor-specific [Candidatus Moranbacteria bacterium RIFOXYC1_FULL_44_13]
MNIKEILRNTRLSPLDAEILLSLAVNVPREYLFTHPEHRLIRSQNVSYKLYVSKRLRGEPIAYITGKKEFYGLEFEVNKNVLIPRPETELLVERALDQLLDTKSQMPDTIIDVGAGSGNIIVSIVKNIPTKTKSRINYYAIDISKKALLAAKKNARKHKVAKYIKFIQSDLLKFAPKNLAGNILITANLPYVSPSLYKKNKNNLKYEPKNALISKKNGLGYYVKFFRQIQQLCTICCVLRVTCYVEISPEQKTELTIIVKKELPSAQIKFFKDLSRKWRIAEISAFVDKKCL